MTELLVREFAAGLHVREDSDGRTLEGAVVPYGVEARVLDRGRLVVETFERGALVGTDPAELPLMARHPRDGGELPIGVAVELRDEPAAWWGVFRVSATRLGDEVLELVRDGALTGLSVGFLELPGGSRWSPDRRRVVRVRARGHHVATVPFPAYQTARIAAVRAAHAPATAHPLATLARRFR